MYDYKFKEKSVEALFEDVSTFCLQSLKEIFENRDLKNPDFDSCSYDENDPFSRQMNEKLIEHFEDSLSAFENRERRSFATKSLRHEGKELDRITG